jgi:hypothetical protein
MEELLNFFRERIAIEEDYSRRMLSLSKRFNITGIYETGQLGSTLQDLKTETEAISKSHLNESRKLKFNVYDKMETFLSSFNGKKKQIQSSIENLVSSKKMLLQNVLKLKERYQSETSKLNTYIAQDQLLLGKELEKNRDRIYKQQQVVSEIRTEYQVSCAKLGELNNYWIQEWKNSASIFQYMESERIEFTVKQLWDYSNLVSTACVNDDSTCEKLRTALELCDPVQEIAHFVSRFQTGSQIYQSPKFVDFVNNGNIEEDAANGGVINVSNGDTRSTSTSARLSSHSEQTIVQNHQHQLHHQQQQQQQQQMRSLDPHAQSHHQQAQNAIKNIAHRVNVQRRPPPSEDGQTSISNPSTNLSSNTSSTRQRQESSYSNPTSISTFSDNVNNELRSSQNWNSPSRRRSRNSDVLSVASKKSTTLANRRSFVLDHSQSNRDDGAAFVDLTNEDPLRATLEDLKIGGNGDMNKFKEYISHNNSKSARNSFHYQEAPKSVQDAQFRTSVSSTKTNNNTTVTRPKSMLNPDLNPMVSPSKKQQSSKRSSLYAGVRSSSRSSINLQSKLQNNGFPTVTSTGKRILKICKALFDFAATLEGELSFQQEDILFVVHMQEDGWWECENSRTGEQGLAPYNYVEQV